MSNIFTRSALRVVFAALTASLACLAQNVTFGLSSGTGSPGSTVTLDISVDTPTGIAPAAVAWTVNYPGIDFSSAVVTASPAATAAG